MNYDRSFGFIGGFLLGGIVGAAVALLLAPASGEETRKQIQAEGVALKNRGQEFGDDRMHDAQKMVKQGKRGLSDAQTRLGREIEDQKDNLQVAMGK
jgi:gas vesicle protein